MALLPADGTLSYNGVTFSSLFRSKITGRPVPDTAGRTVKNVEYELVVEGCIQDDNGTDVTMDSWRNLLQQNGGQLEYMNKGAGDISINTPGGQRDVKYGPWPKLLYFQPVGASQAARVGWTCTFCIPQCPNGAGQRFVQFCFDIVWTIDVDGFTQVVYTGEVEIPATRLAAGDKTVPATIDDYREAIASAFPLLPAMQRESWEWHLSQDRRTYHFNIKDKETPVPYPLDVTTISAQEDLTATNEGESASFAVYDLSLRGDITLKRGADKRQILTVAQLIISSRIRPLLVKGFSVTPKSLSLGDNIFGRNGSFSASFRVIGDLRIDALGQGKALNINQIARAMVAASELWTPIATTNYPAWQKSLSDSPGHPRGFLKARHRRQDDAIIDLCNDDQPRRVSGGRANPRRNNVPPAVIFGENLHPGNSWIDYQITTEYSEDGGSIQHTPVGNVRELGPATRGVDAVKPGIEAGLIEAVNPKLRQTRDPDRSIVITGSAKRLGFRIPPPVLLQIGGVPVKEESRWESEKIVESVGGIPVWETRWRIRYTVNEAPKGDMKPQRDAIKLRRAESSQYTR